LERYFIVPDAVDFVRTNKFYAIGNGLVFVSLLFIPLLGALVAVPLGAAAGTIGVVERQSTFV
jgi:CysZ protein